MKVGDFISNGALEISRDEILGFGKRLEATFQRLGLRMVKINKKEAARGMYGYATEGIEYVFRLPEGEEITRRNSWGDRIIGFKGIRVLLRKQSGTSEKCPECKMQYNIHFDIDGKYIPYRKRTEYIMGFSDPYQYNTDLNGFVLDSPFTYECYIIRRAPLQCLAHQMRGLLELQPVRKAA